MSLDVLSSPPRSDDFPYRIGFDQALLPLLNGGFESAIGYDALVVREVGRSNLNDDR